MIVSGPRPRCNEITSPEVTVILKERFRIRYSVVSVKSKTRLRLPVSVSRNFLVRL